MDTHNIRNIIFDLGGVIVNIDPQLTANAFAKLSGTDPVDIMALHRHENFFTDYEKGLIDDRTFRENLREFIGKRVTDEEIDTAWGAILMDIPEKKIVLIEKARQHCRTFLLSNTNNIHRIKFTGTLKDLTGQHFEDYFEKVYYSFRMGKRKPDEDIFLQVLSENNLTAEETLLIDDSFPNIETARKLGMKVLHVERNTPRIGLNINGR